MKIAYFTLFALGLSASLAIPAFAQDTPTDEIIPFSADQIPGDFSAAIEEAAEGRELFLAGNHAEALELLWPLADAGNPVAQNLLGISLTERNSAYIPYDPQEGFRYLLAAGEQNFGPAMHNLGDTYEEEHGDISPNIEESSRWFIAAAELGYESAYYNAGYALVNGYGVPENLAAGRTWLELALDGDERAYALGMFGDLAYFGQGQPQDYELSLEFYVQSAAAGIGTSAWYAAYQYLNGQGTAVDEPAALPLLEQAVAGGTINATGSLAQLLSRGVEGTPPDTERAISVALQGDEQGSGYASTVLGDFHREGVGTEVDFDLARAAYERGMERGDAFGSYQLGDMAYLGLGQPENHPLAFEFYQAALEIDPEHTESLYSIAYMQMRGIGTEVDLASATEFLERTIERRHWSSMIEAIELYGSPAYAGPQSDEVHAQAFCLYDEIQGWPSRDAANFADNVATCARLTEELSEDDQARAAEIAATF